MQNKRKIKGALAAIVAIMIVLITAVCLFVAFCRADDISVEGCDLYLESEIIEASGIKEGTFLFSVDREVASDRILHLCSVVHDVDIELKLPNKVIIRIKEDVPKFMAHIGVSTVMFDHELRVAAVSSNSNEFNGIEVLLPGVEQAISGERIKFVEDEPSYITVILNAIARSELFDRIVSVDCTSARNANAVADSRFKLIFGGTSELELKLKVAAEYLDIERVASAKSATLDLTSPKEVIVTIND